MTIAEPTTRLQTAALLADIAQARQAIEQWQAFLDERMQILMGAYEAGDVPSKFPDETHSLEYSLLPGKVTFDYADSVKQIVKDIQEKAKQSGLAEQKQGKPYWRINKIKQKN